MPTEVRLLNHVPEEEQARFACAPDVFAVAEYGYQWRDKDWFIVLYEDGQAVSQVEILKHSIKVNGAPIVVGGIGGVVTVPEKQGQGYARLALQHAVDFMKNTLHVQFGLLFCLSRLVPYYERWGWQVLADPVIIQQSGQAVVSALVVMVLPCQEQAWPGGKVELESLPW